MAEKEELAKQKRRSEMIERAIEFAEQFGIERKDIGKAILNSVSKGKLDLSNITGETKREKKSGFEHFMEALVKGIPFYIAALILWIIYRWVTHVWMP